MLIGLSSPPCTNSGPHLYLESTTLITEIEVTGVQLKSETCMIEWHIALSTNLSKYDNPAVSLL